ncbi:acyltransferase family protein [Actinomadura madurae]|uniref:acyltransferase family protein n=1 Tax=Actinomadura madurae TaxID=1993 RepID=UPI0020D22FA6|nr:acyltransferase family protein [Actinomadura madurae]MCP9967344.1 acyltransferase family protein [Actinomadura madurae]
MHSAAEAPGVAVAGAAAVPGTATAPGTATGPATTPAPRPAKKRDPFFDNAKYFAILLVVAGHSLANLLNVPLAKGLYIFIYMFHMPLFIVITGYFSRNWTFAGGKARKLITNVGVPYVVFEVAYSLYDWLAGRNELEISLLNPYYLTWFLCALFMWRLSTPVWQQIRWPLAVALVFALLSYMSDIGGTFDIHRVLGLLPFYVLGLCLKPVHFELLKKPIARPIGAVVLAARPRRDVPGHEPHVAQLDLLEARARGPRGRQLRRDADAARDVRLRDRVRRRVPQPDPAPGALVHPPRRLHAVRLPAARVRHPSPELHRLVGRRLDAHPARGGHRDRRRPGGRYVPVLQARRPDDELGTGAEDDLGVHPLRRPARSR